jgi:hypothetical protein
MTWSATKQRGNLLPRKPRGTSPLRGRKHSLDTCALISVKLKGRTKGPASAEHRARNSASKCRPIMTPTGVFPSRLAAVEWARANGLLNAGRRLDQWLKTNPTQFYYIKANK